MATQQESKPQLHVVQLYPRDMNIYGDFGNALSVQRQLEWRGYEPVMHTYDPGDTFPTTADIIVGGGGQDSGQGIVQDDLLSLAPKLHELADAGVPMLMICGLYQMFGKFFRTIDGTTITGIGVLDVETIGKPERLIGNIVTHSDEFGDIVGYENHSGQTFLGSDAVALGTVLQGEGNNTEDTTEGARSRNVIGSYLHGSLLPKNPALTDFLIDTAIRNRGLDPASVKAVSPSGQAAAAFARNARDIAKKRPR